MTRKSPRGKKVSSGPSRARRQVRKAEPVDPASIEAAIRARAYQIHLDRGDAGSDPMEDWLLAEREIRGEEG